MTVLKSIAKAVTAGGVAFCGALATAATDDVVTTAEWATVAGATLAALALVWRVPNASPPAGE